MFEKSVKIKFLPFFFTRKTYYHQNGTEYVVNCDFADADRVSSEKIDWVHNYGPLKNENWRDQKTKICAISQTVYISSNVKDEFCL